MSTGTTCILTVGGVRFADQRTDDPVALSGLTVVWGRDTTVDQPAPSTCTFTVSDRLGSESFLDLLHTGLTVDVSASATEYPAPSVPTFDNPGFETDPVAVVANNAVVGASPRVVHGGARALQVVPDDPNRRWAVVLPPAPFVPAGTNPGAWDGIPQTAPGQTWDVGAWVYAPVGTELTVQAVLFTGPWDGAYRGAGPVQVFAGSGQWVQVAIPFLPEVAGAWVGLFVSAYPTGPRWADATGMWADQDPATTWQDLVAVYVDDVTVLAPAAGTPRTVLVFSGRITNLQANWSDGLGAVVEVTAADFTADLANRRVGDEPWAVEPMGDRFQRILTLAGAPVTAEIDTTVSGIPVSWVDVDSQPATGLLQDLATSVDAVMWSAVHQTTGAYLKVEDPSNRIAGYRLVMVGGIVVIQQAGAGAPLSACDVLRDPVTFHQDVSDVATRAAVTWQEQLTDDQGQPTTTEHTVTVIDADLETQYGTRAVSLTSQLITAADAVTVADRLMARLTVGGWRAGGFVVDDDLVEQVGTMLQLLDGTSRIGLAVRVTDLPPWSPGGGEDLPLYLEGGQYRFDDGRWVLDLGVSSASGQGDSVAWNELDAAWRWMDVEPTMTWTDVFGVAGPELLEVAA